MTIVDDSSGKQQPLMVRDLLDTVIRTGINITPEALLRLDSMNITVRELEEFLQKFSYSDAPSIITVKVLQQEFLKIMEDAGMEVELIPVPLVHEPKKQPENMGEDPKPKKQETKKKEDQHQPHLTNKAQPPAQLQKDELGKTHISQDNNLKQKEKPISPQTSTTSKPQGLKSPEANFPELKQQETLSSKKEVVETPVAVTSPKPEIPVEDEELRIAKIREEKRREWEALQIRAGTSTFRPIAADYNEEMQILQDPTGKLYTEGKLGDFLAVQIDKFKRTKKILMQRPEASGIYDIGMINRLNNSVEIKFIGMVIEKRQAASRNYILTLEDPTGMCSVLVRQDNHELYSLMEKVLPDHILLIDGYLSVNQKSDSRIVMANQVIFPEPPKTHTTKFPEEDLAICMISDTHFGSKDWLGKVWHRFVDYLNCRIGNDKQLEQAGKIKYITIAGDLVDGIGVYPNQEKRLSIIDIYKQYEAVADYFSEIPDYIKIIFSPGDHDAVRKAVPAPAVPDNIIKSMKGIGVTSVGCPAVVSLHGIKTEIFHGTSLIDMNMSIPGLTNEDPHGTMTELIRARHLAPSYGRKTELAPTEMDWLVLEDLPDILHTGHLHKNGFGFYNGILTVNSGCFQAQTDYMASFGIDPDFGKPTIVNIKGPRLVPKVIDLATDL